MSDANEIRRQIEGTDDGSIKLLLRCAVAITQGAALVLLLNANDAPRHWAATEPLIFTPALLALVIVPFVVILGIGQIGGRALAIWTTIMTLAVLGLGVHAAWRGALSPFSYFAYRDPKWPGGTLWIAVGASVFIAQALFVDSMIERRWAPSYARHFDTAWKQGVQLALAVVFVGLFWGVIALGAELFKLVGLDFFQRLIQRRPFWCPATILAFAVAFHVTDVRPQLIRGARTLVLTLFSWLLPLLALILAGFLASLPFLSLAVLWKTGFATRLLLAAAIGLVVLINACYQDGSDERTRSRLKRWAGTIGALELTPIACLSIAALWSRVAQYGLTSSRVEALATVAVVCCYATGYALAVARSPSWLKGIERANVTTAYVILAVIVALFSPLADPARLMVASQVARLDHKRVAPEAFDFTALKFDGARWGRAALETLAQDSGSPEAPIVRKLAATALEQKFWVKSPFKTPAALTMSEKLARVSVFPEGRSLPPEIITLITDAKPFSPCFQGSGSGCVARFIALGAGEHEALLLLQSSFGPIEIYNVDDGGQWRRSGTLIGSARCGDFKARFARGDIDLAPHPSPDFVIGGNRFIVSQPSLPCPPPRQP